LNLKKLTDFHCHILPGIDDGPESIDESIEMAAALRDVGFTSVYCTPHFLRGCYEADAQAIRSTVSDLQSRLDEENINIELLYGREYYLDEFFDNILKDPVPLSNTKYLMIEIPNNMSAEFVKDALFRIKCGGFIPMIAHPERCRLFNVDHKKKKSRLWYPGQKRRKTNSTEEGNGLILYLQDIGCAFQGNLGSFGGLYGPEVKQTANQLMEQGLFTHFGTDSHSMRSITYLKISTHWRSLLKA
jgi:protein-tyrosine phosphatase